MMNDLNDHDNDDDDNRQNPAHFSILTTQPKSFPPCQLLVYSVKKQSKKGHWQFHKPFDPEVKLKTEKILRQLPFF